MIAQMDKLAAAEKGSGSGGEEGDGGHDPMLDQAVEVVIDAGQASTSLLQRRCKLGYARAARIMDEMEQLGVIGPYQGAKPREVLITRPVSYTHLDVYKRQPTSRVVAASAR